MVFKPGGRIGNGHSGPSMLMPARRVGITTIQDPAAAGYPRASDQSQRLAVSSDWNSSKVTFLKTVNWLAVSAILS